MRTGSGKTSGHDFQDLTQSDFHPWKIGGTGSATLIDPEPAAYGKISEKMDRCRICCYK